MLFIKRNSVWLLSLLLVLCVVIGGLLFIINWAFYDIDRINGQELLSEKKSPDGKYLVKTYLNNGGATTSYSVLGELVFLKENKKSKNIYWESGVEEGHIVWDSNNVVTINNRKIEVPNGKFDYRHDE